MPERNEAREELFETAKTLLEAEGDSRLEDLARQAIFVLSSAKLPTLAEQEKLLIELHLKQSKGNRTLAAKKLGISRGGLLKMMKRYGIE
jgi:transcriptional regulator with PAS, ATPase and Fis domain